MKAEAHPGKINNQLNENICSSTVTMTSLLKQLKNQSRNDGQSTSSKTSKFSDQTNLQNFRDLYNRLESGEISKDAFKAKVAETTPINAQFEKTLNDPHRSYKELVKTLETKKKNVNGDLYDTKKSPTVISSTALTTVKVPTKSNLNTEDLNEKIKSYSQGFTSRSDFISYLQEKKVPVTDELQKNIRLHEETKSVPFHKFGQCIYSSLNESENVTSFIGSPNKKNPNSYRFVNRPNLGKGDALTKEKMKEETIKKEYDKLGNGVYLTHKRKIQTKITDNGELTLWEPDYSTDLRKTKTMAHLQHHDIFSWDGSEKREPVVRKAAIVQKAALNSGDIIKWQN